MSEARLPGEQLREERVRQGLGEDDISARLRLSRSYVRALESDDYERLPPAAFVRGYIRNYAQMLEMDGEVLVAEFQRLHQDLPGGSEPLTVEDSERDMATGLPFWVWPAGAVALVLVVLVLWLTGEREPGATPPEPDARQAEESAEAGSPESATQAAPDTRVAAPEMEVEPLEPGDSPEGLSPDGRQGPEQELAAVEGPDQLRLRFSEDCWLEVHEADSGEQLYQGNQGEGAELELGGTAPFRVTLGNAPALAGLEVNGESMELPGGRAGQVVRITVP